MAHPTSSIPRAERIAASPQWRGQRFANDLRGEKPRLWTATREFLFGQHRDRRPSQPIPVVKRRGAELALAPASGLRVTWFGHSTNLIDIDGARVLVDPVFGERASPLSWAGPKRFFAPPLALHELPPVDAIAISHDHYDHLDRGTVLALAVTPTPFVVPLGVGAHLESWGIAAERIIELDWWQSHEIAGVEITATPARHFSGRAVSMSDRDRTLWAGFAIRGRRHRVYYSGDTAMFPGFAEIGSRLGPFDLGLIEAGAYNPLWRDVHIGPEQAVVAAELTRSTLLMPVHWATFDLALHPWTEPVERVLEAAARARVDVVTPRPGASVEPAERPGIDRWWPALGWRHAGEDPVISTGLDRHLLGRITELSMR